MQRQRRVLSSSLDVPVSVTVGSGRPETLNLFGRRRFLGAAALTMAGAQACRLGVAEAGAPRELGGLAYATGWLNSPPLTAASLAGKVVLIEFLTYTCINWLRTLPHVRAWARRYTGRLVVIGVHTPEFTFEGNPDNVRRSMQRMKIDYPVAIDSNHSIWRAFDNQYWPALYLIDARGRIRHHRFGEGAYEQSELAIQRLLAEGGLGRMDEGPVSVEETEVEAQADWDNLRSTETYVGHDRAERFASPGGAVPGTRRVYGAPARLALNEWALAGEWTVGGEATILSRERGRLSYRFHARDLHLVMGPSRTGAAVPFRVSIDGQPPGPAHGVDADSGGAGKVVEQRLYQLVRQPGPIVDRTFEIEFAGAGVEAYAFTFG